MEEKKPIVLFDSGVGGLTIAREVIEEFPHDDIIYFGDTAHLPYGERPPAEVKSFVMKIIDYFQDINPKIVIIACNTATAAGLEEAQDRFSLPIIGPIKPGVKKAIRHTNKQKVGVIGTEGTINSKAYQSALREASSEVEIFAKACPDFVSLVEEGELYSERTLTKAREYLTPLKEKGIDTLLLGCTHFPYLAEAIQEVMGEKVKLIYPGYSIALQAREIFAKQGDLASEGEQEKHFYVSQLARVSDRFVKLGKKFLSFAELEFEELNLWDEIKEK